MMLAQVKSDDLPTVDKVLQAVCLAYWRERDDNPQGRARGVLHELVMTCFRATGIEYQDREDAASIAREIAYKEVGG